MVGAIGESGTEGRIHVHTLSRPSTGPMFPVSRGTLLTPVFLFAFFVSFFLSLSSPAVPCCHFLPLLASAAQVNKIIEQNETCNKSESGSSTLPPHVLVDGPQYRLGAVVGQRFTETNPTNERGTRFAGASLPQASRRCRPSTAALVNELARAQNPALRVRERVTRHHAPTVWFRAPD